ncbi:Disease resistance RPP13-like protein [Actinidia chinensis var. chinensis]|uniref:Disease resistance RPP13-like protein n=1 Tax=Actinidia chinensis var. chinensis TaxID=1590841 RepID=A0A2R6P784_ACTCC|nr:Disease resistance RPP13-like protein [Actinidia chinensis var. chinensis]
MHHIEVADTKVLYGLKNMNCLKFLSIRGISMVTELPSFISELINLKILDLKACHSLEVVPDGIGSLIRLTHLDLFECIFLEYMHKSPVNLSKLQVLKGFFIGDSKDNNPSCALGNLSGLRRLRKLNIYTSVRPLELPSQLQKLDLQCFPRTSLPSWLRPANLKELNKLYIRGGRLCDLGQFQILNDGDQWAVEILRLTYLEGEWIDRKAIDQDQSTFVKLQQHCKTSDASSSSVLGSSPSLTWNDCSIISVFGPVQTSLLVNLFLVFYPFAENHLAPRGQAKRSYKIKLLSTKGQRILQDKAPTVSDVEQDIVYSGGISIRPLPSSTRKPSNFLQGEDISHLRTRQCFVYDSQPVEGFAKCHGLRAIDRIRFYIPNLCTRENHYLIEYVRTDEFKGEECSVSEEAMFYGCHKQPFTFQFQDGTYSVISGWEEFRNEYKVEEGDVIRFYKAVWAWSSQHFLIQHVKGDEAAGTHAKNDGCIPKISAMTKHGHSGGRGQKGKKFGVGDCSHEDRNLTKMNR